MSRRNVWLSFDEWELICNDLSDQKYHSFKLSPLKLKEWKKEIKDVCKISGPDAKNSDSLKYCFERVGIFPEVEQVRTSFAINTLCREGWRFQDISDVMQITYSFIGLIVNYCDEVNMNTTLEEWEEIRKKMNDKIDESDQKSWSDFELIRLYHQVV